MKRKNVSIELIRIIAMLMVVTLHTNGYGFNAVWSTMPEKKWIVLSEIICIIAVDLYILITGYFLKNFKFSIKKILRLELAVIIYNVGIYLALVVFHKIDFNYLSFIKKFFPVLTQAYWFYTSYFVLYFLLPFFKKAYLCLEKQNMTKALVIVLIILTSLFPSIYPSNDILAIRGGYSYIWFFTLIFTSAYLRDHKLKLSNIKKIVITILIIIIQYVLYYHSKNIHILDLVPAWRNYMFSYNSILVFIQAIMIFTMLSEIEIKNKIVTKTILFLSPLTFAVYLIHLQPDLLPFLWKKFLYHAGYVGTSKVYLYYFADIFGVYFACSFIEFIRITVFKLIGKIKIFNKLSNLKILSKIDSAFNKEVEYEGTN